MLGDARLPVATRRGATVEVPGHWVETLHLTAMFLKARKDRMAKPAPKAASCGLAALRCGIVIVSMGFRRKPISRPKQPALR